MGISLVLIAGFILLSKYEDRAFMRNLDFAVTVKVQEHIDRSAHLRVATVVGNIMEGATFFASPEFTVIGTLLITAILFYDQSKKRWRLVALLIPFALVLIVAAEVLGKTVVHHPSPSFTMIKHPTTIFPANYINEQFSYPSGHAARAVFLALIAWMLLPALGVSKNRKRFGIGIFLGLYVAIVSVSRIYLGHHWFSDVLGGLLMGTGITLLFTVPLLAVFDRHLISK